MSAYSEKQRKLFVMGGFDGWECLNSMEVLDLNNIDQQGEQVGF